MGGWWDGMVTVVVMIQPCVEAFELLLDLFVRLVFKVLEVADDVFEAPLQGSAEYGIHQLPALIAVLTTL